MRGPQSDDRPWYASLHSYQIDRESREWEPAFNFSMHQRDLDRLEEDMAAIAGYQFDRVTGFAPAPEVDVRGALAEISRQDPTGSKGGPLELARWSVESPGVFDQFVPVISGQLPDAYGTP
jgi:hypothetical protein